MSATAASVEQGAATASMAKLGVESEQFVRAILDGLTAHVAVVDETGVIVAVNQSWKNFATQNGQPDQDYLGTNYFELCETARGVAAEGAQAFVAGMRRVHAGELTCFDMEYPCHSPDRQRWFGAHVARFPVAQRNLILVTHDDITARKLAENALRENEERLRTLIDATPDIICFKDAAGRWLLANQSILNLYEIKGVDYRHKTEFELAEFTAPLFRAAFQQCGDSDEKAWAANGLSRTEEVIPSADGTPNTFDVIKIPLFHADGQRRALIVVGRNITERKLAEEQLRLQSAMLQAAANSIFIADRAGQLLWVNTAFTRLTGYSAEEAVGQNARLLKSGKHDALFYSRLWTTILAGEVWHGELINKRKDGTLYTEEMTVTPVRNAEGKVHRFIAIKQDVTLRRELEESLRQAQKMESIGRLAGGIAHDFNNSLQTILGFNELLMAITPPMDPRSGDLEEIKKAAAHAANLTQQLLAFSRRQTLTMRVLDLNNALQDSEKMLRRLLGEDVQLDLRLAADLARTKADQSQLVQIVLNLAVNARDAMPKGGRLTLSTYNITFDEQAVAALPGARPGSYVCLAVSDTGCGMTADVQQHIFEPFYTTKDPGQGTGLGLAVIYGIVKQSDGWIHVYSELGQGSTFKIYFPAFTGDASQVAVDQETSYTAEVLGHGERILLVEDEPAVRQLAHRVCVKAGYEVVTCATMQEAEQIWAREKGRFDLLFSDVVLADRNGIELAAHLLAQRPTLPVLLCSGYSDERSRWNDIAERNYHYLQKPYPVAALLQAIRQTLASADAAQA